MKTWQTLLVALLMFAGAVAAGFALAWLVSGWVGEL